MRKHRNAPPAPHEGGDLLSVEQVVNQVLGDLVREAKAKKQAAAEAARHERYHRMLYGDRSRRAVPPWERPVGAGLMAQALERALGRENVREIHRHVVAVECGASPGVPHSRRPHKKQKQKARGSRAQVPDRPLSREERLVRDGLPCIHPKYWDEWKLAAPLLLKVDRRDYKAARAWVARLRRWTGHPRAYQALLEIIRATAK